MLEQFQQFQQQNDPGRDCAVCGWPIGTVGHEVNCEERP
jgi:hypothetical protein